MYKSSRSQGRWDDQNVLALPDVLTLLSADSGLGNTGVHKKA